MARTLKSRDMHRNVIAMGAMVSDESPPYGRVRVVYVIITSDRLSHQLKKKETSSLLVAAMFSGPAVRPELI